MTTGQSGFTLIELVMVILILGILAATAIPKFTNLQADAQTAATDGVAGALGSASAINFAVRSLNSSNGVQVLDCSSVASALEGGLDPGYAITSAGITAGASTTCTLTGPSSTTASFVGHGVN